MDAYGRIVGRVVAIDRDSYGELEGVQIESVGGNILGAKMRQIDLTPDTITLTPDWKLDLGDLMSELSLLRKRISGLESLRSSGEVDAEISAELLEAQRSGYLGKVKSGESLARTMKVRLNEITGQVSSLTKCLLHTKLGHKTGEVDDASLKLAQDSIKPTLRALIAERNDLVNDLKEIEKILPTRVELN